MRMIKKSFNISADLDKRLDAVLRENPGMSFTWLVTQALIQWVNNPQVTIRNTRVGSPLQSVNNSQQEVPFIGSGNFATNAPSGIVASTPILPENTATVSAMGTSLASIASHVAGVASVATPAAQPTVNPAPTSTPSPTPTATSAAPSTRQVPNDDWMHEEDISEALKRKIA